MNLKTLKVLCVDSAASNIAGFSSEFVIFWSALRFLKGLMHLLHLSTLSKLQPCNGSIQAPYDIFGSNLEDLSLVHCLETL